jgi:tetratricopeptide (TPR) repeat protein
MSLRPPVVLAVALLATLPPASPTVARGARSASPLSATRYGIVVDVPETRRVVVRRDVPYRIGARDTLALDLYLPPGHRGGRTWPAVVFLNAIGDAPGQEPLKEWGIYATWPRLVAAHGLAGISMEADPERVPESLAGLFEFLEREGPRLGVDPARLGVYAASANVTRAAEYLLGDRAARGIRAAVLYYGRPPQASPRPDLPVMMVIAESDANPADTLLTGLWRRVVEADAPWTLVYGSRLPHAFDAFSLDEASRRLVRQTIDFWRGHLEPAPAASAPSSPEREILAALYGNAPGRAEPLLARWTVAHPDDAEGFVQHARALAALQRLPEATAAYERAYALDPAHPGAIGGLGMALMGSQQWERAEPLLARAAEIGMGGSQMLGALGFAQLHLGRNAEAARSYERAFAAGIPPGPNTRGAASYNLACAYARLGRADTALEALEQAAREGFGTRAGWEADPDLTTLHGDPRWPGIVARLPR